MLNPEEGLEEEVSEEITEEVPEEGVQPEPPAEGEPQEEPDYKSLYEKEKEIHENLNTGIHQEREEKKRYRDLYNQAQGQVQSQQPQQPQKAEGLSVADDDYPTFGQIKQLMQEKEQQQQQVQQGKQLHSMKVNQAEASLRTEFTDYDEVTKAGLQELQRTNTPQQIDQMYWQSDPTLIPRMLYGLGQSVKNKTVSAQAGRDTANALVNKPSQPKSANVKGGKTSAKGAVKDISEVPLFGPDYDKWKASLTPKQREEHGFED